MFVFCFQLLSNRKTLTCWILTLLEISCSLNLIWPGEYKHRIKQNINSWTFSLGANTCHDNLIFNCRCHSETRICQHGSFTQSSNVCFGHANYYRRAEYVRVAIDVSLLLCSGFITGKRVRAWRWWHFLNRSPLNFMSGLGNDGFISYMTHTGTAFYSTNSFCISLSRNGSAIVKSRFIQKASGWSRDYQY